MIDSEASTENLRLPGAVSGSDAAALRTGSATWQPSGVGQMKSRPAHKKKGGHFASALSDLSCYFYLERYYAALIHDSINPEPGVSTGPALSSRALTIDLPNTVHCMEKEPHKIPPLLTELIKVILRYPYLL